MYRLIRNNALSTRIVILLTKLEKGNLYETKCRGLFEAIHNLCESLFYVREWEGNLYETKYRFWYETTPNECDSLFYLRNHLRFVSYKFHKIVNICSILKWNSLTNCCEQQEEEEEEEEEDQQHQQRWQDKHEIVILKYISIDTLWEASVKGYHH